MKLLLALALAGCSTVASGVSSLVKPKPPEVTVVTNVSVAADKHHEGPGLAMVAGGVAGGVAAALVRASPEVIASGALVGVGVGYVVHAISD